MSGPTDPMNPDDVAPEARATPPGDGLPSASPPARRGTTGAHAASRARRIGGRPSPTARGHSAQPSPAQARSVTATPAKGAPAKGVTAKGESRTAGRRRPQPGPDRSPATKPKPALRRGARVALAVLLAVVVAVIALDLTWLGGLRHPGGHQQSTTAADRQFLLSQAKAKVAKVASYDYRHIDQDAKDAAAGTTGAFTATYDKSIQTVVKPLAEQVKAIVACSIQTAGISSVSADGKQAVVLIYAQLSTQNSTTNGQSRLDIATIQATMNKQGSGWYISKLDRE